ncbi:MAG: ThiF family adenylyltransferase [Planctomycetota bacterium]
MWSAGNRNGDEADSASIRPPFRNRSIAVLGCGSVGSVAAWMIAGMGAHEIILIDRDTLSRDNLRRHPASADAVDHPKVCAVADFVASRLDSQRNVQVSVAGIDTLDRTTMPHGDREDVYPRSLSLFAFQFDALEQIEALARIIARVDAMFVAVDDERLRYAAAYAARQWETPTVMAGVYGGGWGCEAILEGVSNRLPCYGCASAALGRVGVPLERMRHRYVGQPQWSPTDRLATKPNRIATPTSATHAAASAIHVSTAAAFAATALWQALEFCDAKSPAMEPAIARRMCLPSNDRGPHGKIAAMPLFCREDVPVVRRRSCLECGDAQPPANGTTW